MAKKNIGIEKIGVKLSERPSDGECAEKCFELIDREPLFREMQELLCSEYDSIHLLHPYEMWEEAKAICKQIAASKYPKNTINMCHTKLQDEYAGIKDERDKYSFASDRGCETEAAKEVFLCVHYMLLGSDLEALKGVPEHIRGIMYFPDWMKNKGNKAFELAKKDEHFDGNFYIKDAPKPQGALPKTERRENGIQMVPVVAMMDKLWPKMRFDKSFAMPTERDKARLLSLLTGWSEDAIYNLMTGDRFKEKLSAKQHGDDISKANEVLRAFQVKRPITFEK